MIVDSNELDDKSLGQEEGRTGDGCESDSLEYHNPVKWYLGRLVKDGNERFASCPGDYREEHEG